MNQNLTEQKSLTCYPVAKRVLLSSKFKLLITVITPQTEAARKLHTVMIRMIIRAWQGADHWYCGAAPLHRSPLHTVLHSLPNCKLITAVAYTEITLQATRYKVAYNKTSINASESL